MGLMLETTSSRLLAKRRARQRSRQRAGEAAARDRDAGRQRIPFTTGILIGIGETLEERVDTLIAIRDLHDRYGHIQEVIVQNFRAKPGTLMANWPEPDRDDMLRTLAVARLLMPEMNIQAPPNLSDPHYADLLDGGINDWGGSLSADAGFHQSRKALAASGSIAATHRSERIPLRQRLPVYPEFAPMPRGAPPDLLQQRLHESGLNARIWRRGMITVLTGGTGGAKFVDGLRQIIARGRTDHRREYRR
jgi:7,8-didemethyl-8-hydroxy-5-deazariboflavin synthase CofG subunit